MHTYIHNKQHLVSRVLLFRGRGTHVFTYSLHSISDFFIVIDPGNGCWSRSCKGRWRSYRWISSSVMRVTTARPCKARGNAIRPGWMSLPMLLDPGSVVVTGNFSRRYCPFIAYLSPERMAAHLTCKSIRKGQRES